MKPPEIRERLKATGRTQAALGKAIGKKKDSVSRLLLGERSMDVDEAAAIRAFFGDDQVAGPTFLRIPVYGYAAAGGDDHVAIASDHVLDWVEIPAGMVRPDAFAIRVAGESMEPRLYSGEQVIVNPGVPPLRDGDCVVEMRDGSALVKQYRGQRDGVVFLNQHNPPREIRVDASKVKTIHAVAIRR